jgi:hypothetical protein
MVSALAPSMAENSSDEHPQREQEPDLYCCLRHFLEAAFLIGVGVLIYYYFHPILLYNAPWKIAPLTVLSAAPLYVVYLLAQECDRVLEGRRLRGDNGFFFHFVLCTLYVIKIAASVVVMILVFNSFLWFFYYFSMQAVVLFIIISCKDLFLENLHTLRVKFHYLTQLGHSS